MHRTMRYGGHQGQLLFVADFSGLFHCLDAKTGKAALDLRHGSPPSWASPLIVEGQVYIGDEDGDITIFKLSPEKEMLGEINMGSALYTTPIVAEQRAVHRQPQPPVRDRTRGVERTGGRAAVGTLQSDAVGET